MHTHIKTIIGYVYKYHTQFFIAWLKKYSKKYYTCVLCQCVYIYGLDGLVVSLHLFNYHTYG